MSGGSTRFVVVLAVDGSVESQAATDYYIQHVHRPDNHVVITNVVELPDLAHARQAQINPRHLQDLWKTEEEKSKTLEEAYKDRLKAAGVSHIHCKTKGGTKPGHAICEVAKDQHANMVVMGTRGMGKLRRTILGSVSDYVVHHAGCPVVICRDVASDSK